MILTAPDIRLALTRWCIQMRLCAPELNALDGELGDGDLGVTLSKCAEFIEAARSAPPDTLTELFKSSAKACMVASGSSFGTLLAVGFLTAAKATASLDQLTLADVAGILHKAGDAISIRGGAKPGDKTFLDTLLAAQAALTQPNAAVNPREAVLEAVTATIADFRNKPNRIGRARIFAEKSIGLDDPGMIAFQRMVEAL